MHKDELIQLHTLLSQIKAFVDRSGPTGAFVEYDRLGVSPTHVHRSKTDHKRAIFVLGKELATALATTEFSGPARLSRRLEVMAQRLDGPVRVVTPI